MKKKDMLRLLEDALTRMDRARDILTDGKPRLNCNWGMLSTEGTRLELEKMKNEKENKKCHCKGECAGKEYP